MKFKVISLTILLMFIASISLAGNILDEKMISPSFDLIDRAGVPVGSATVIYSNDGETLVLTAYHAIKGNITLRSPNLWEKKERKGEVIEEKEDLSIKVQEFDGSNLAREIMYYANIEDYDREFDLALLKIRGNINLPSALLLPKDKEVNIGDEVWIVGMTIGFSRTTSVGTLSHKARYIKELNKSVLWQTTAPMGPGNSGGAAFTKDGYLIGVPVIGIRGISMGFLVPIDIIREFLSQTKYAEKFGLQRSYKQRYYYDLR